MPKKHDLAVPAFQTYDSMHAAFARVTPARTTLSDLKAIGFDPAATPNIREVNYLQIAQIFLPHPGIPFSAMPAGVQACVAAQERCTGYIVDPKVTSEKRVGNVALDIFNFRRKTVTTGWSADAMFVLLDGVVVYKVWSGEPRMDSSSTTINPLGPLQNLGGVLERAVPPPKY